LQGSKVEVNLMPVMLKRLHITGSTLRARPAVFKAELTAAVEAAVWPWLAQGSVAPVLHQTFAAQDAASAHKLMEASDHIGKLILSWET
jgi:NADPH2:quinone reductase